MLTANMAGSECGAHISPHLPATEAQQRPPKGVANANVSKVCELNSVVYRSQGNLATKLDQHD